MKLTSKENYYLVTSTVFDKEFNKQLSYEYLDLSKAKAKFDECYKAYSKLPYEKQLHVDTRLSLVNADRLDFSVLCYFGFGIVFEESKSNLLSYIE